MSRAIVILLLVAIVVQAANIFDIFVPMATYLSLVTQVGALGYFLALNVRSPDYRILLSGLGGLLYLTAMHVMFARTSHSAINFNAIAAYLPVLSFITFFRSGCTIRWTLRVLAIVCAAYLLVYLVGHNHILSGDFGGARGINAGDQQRGKRLYLALGFASYAAFYALRVPGNPLVRVALFAAAIAALVLSGSRTYQALFAVILMMSMMRMLTLWVRLAMFAVFLAATGAVMLGLFHPGWNPFDYVATDNSGYARSLEYQYAIEAVRHHWLLGIGIPGSFGSLQLYLRTPLYEPVYTTDLAAIGPWLIFGLPGLILYVVATWFCVGAPMHNMEAPELRALRLNCILCGMYGVLSPSLLLEQNSTFLALLFVAWARNNRAALAGFMARYRRIAPRLAMIGSGLRVAASGWRGRWG